MQGCLPPKTIQTWPLLGSELRTPSAGSNRRVVDPVKAHPSWGPTRQFPRGRTRRSPYNEEELSCPRDKRSQSCPIPASVTDASVRANIKKRLVFSWEFVHLFTSLTQLFFFRLPKRGMFKWEGGTGNPLTLEFLREDWGTIGNYRED